MADYKSATALLQISAEARGMELSWHHQAAVDALLREHESQIAGAMGVYDVEIGKAGRVCAYCGTKHQADRCESCGAPAR